MKKSMEPGEDDKTMNVGKSVPSDMDEDDKPSKSSRKAWHHPETLNNRKK